MECKIRLCAYYQANILEVCLVMAGARREALVSAEPAFGIFSKR